MNTQVATRSDLARLGLDALDKEAAGAVSVSRAAGGVSFASAMEVMEFAKLMAVADKAVPKHLRSNPGACLRIVFQAVEWRMSPWAVADKSYEVNDRIAYESQLIHAVIEARAPLQHRLDVEYIGEGVERQAKIIGQFTNGDMREYLSPKIKDIRVQNSPLWKSDPDQQLFYYASRAWARKWCPDVLMGIYTREELAENPQEPETLEGSGLHQRLAGSTSPTDEGHRDGHAASELDQIAAGAVVEHTEEEEKPARGRKKKAAEAEAEQPAQEQDQQQTEQPEEKLEELPTPTNATEYVAYAERWFLILDNANEIKTRWAKERTLRNKIGITGDERAPLEAKMKARVEWLS